MVVQRNKPVRIAGCAQCESVVVGYFNNAVATGKADSNGEWVIEFPPMEAGGPYDLSVECIGTKYVFHDVLIGDVWFFSGQSNMELFVWLPSDRTYRLPDGKALAAAANDDGLRLLQVHHGLCIDGPCEELPGSPTWKPATTAPAVEDFSAVAYWFGVTLRKKLGGNVPVGLINASWGGSLIEPWIPRFGYENMGCKEILENLDAAKSPIINPEAEKIRKIHLDQMQHDLDDWMLNGFMKTDPAASEIAVRDWVKPDFDDSDWRKCKKSELKFACQPGIIWYRLEFNVPESQADTELVFHSDQFDDADETYLDGKKAGETPYDFPLCWAVQRNYKLGKLAPGRHVIAIRHFDLYSRGIVGTHVSVVTPAGAIIADFDNGPWTEHVEFYANIEKIGVRPAPPSSIIDTNPRTSYQTPTTLFNAEINPATFTNIAGVVWYQGCSNSGNPGAYRKLQKEFISCLRKVWRDPELPFLSTQLSAFRTHNPENRSPDDWWVNDTPDTSLGYAPFRAMQEEFLDLPGSGVACTIDIGDHSDIHPRNKKDVGIRLVHEAMRIYYKQEDHLPGPRFGSAVQEGNALRVTLRNVGDGLTVDGGTFGPHLWSVAGEDGKHYWAEAKLMDDNSVLVSCPEVPSPKHVRYAYYACPIFANFRRKSDGIPVFPFNA